MSIFVVTNKIKNLNRAVFIDAREVSMGKYEEESEDEESDESEDEDDEEYDEDDDDSDDEDDDDW